VTFIPLRVGLPLVGRKISRATNGSSNRRGMRVTK
jgi:hypothetical protein